MGTEAERDTAFHQNRFGITLMNSFCKHVLLMLCMVFAFTCAAADTPYYYYDGGKKLPLTLDPALLAEFNTTGTFSPVAAALTGATAIRVSGTATLYNIPQNQQNSTAVINLINGNSSVSPVFHPGSSLSGPLLALPGGVIVEFNGWDDAKVRSWAATKGYTIQQRLEVPGPQNDWYVLQTPAGLASLNTSNALYESGEVISASPNWWHDHQEN
jgi:hypothetical protein